MPLSPDTPQSYKDPAEVLRDLIRETFASGRVELPATIDLRANVPDIRVEGGDRVTIYEGGKQQRERVGERHYKVTMPLKIDIRSTSRNRAIELRDHIVAELDREAVAPKGAEDWHEVILGDDQVVSSYDGTSGRGGYTHIVIDVNLLNHLRRRKLSRVLETA